MEYWSKKGGIVGRWNIGLKKEGLVGGEILV